MKILHIERPFDQSPTRFFWFALMYSKISYFLLSPQIVNSGRKLIMRSFTATRLFAIKDSINLMGFLRCRIQNDGFDFREDVDFYLQSFLYYAAEINRVVENEIATERKRYDEFNRALETDPTWGHEWFLYEMDLKTKENLADIYIDSLIISMYSFVERKMLFLCQHVEKDQIFKVNDIAGKGVQRYRRYLEGAANLDFMPVQAEWDQLRRYSELRNILVHHAGTRTFLTKNIPLLKFLESAPGVDLKIMGDEISFHFRTNEIIFAFFQCCHSILHFLFFEKVVIS